MCEIQTTTLTVTVGYCLPLCWRQGLFVVHHCITRASWATGLQGLSSVCLLPARGALGGQPWPTAVSFGFTWALELLSQILTHVQQAVHLLSIVPGLSTPSFTLRGRISLNCWDQPLTASVAQVHHELVIPLPKFPEQVGLQDCISSPAGQGWRRWGWGYASKMIKKKIKNLHRVS